MEKFDSIMKAIMGASPTVRYLTFLILAFCVLLVLLLGGRFLYNKSKKYEKYTPEQIRGSMLMLGTASGCLLESLHLEKDFGLELAFAAHTDVSTIAAAYSLDKRIEEQSSVFVSPSFDKGATRLAELRRITGLSVEETLSEDAAHYYDVGTRLSMMSGLLNFVVAKVGTETISISDIRGVILERNNLNACLQNKTSRRVTNLVRRSLEATEPLSTGKMTADTILAAQKELNEIIDIIVSNYKNKEFRL